MPKKKTLKAVKAPQVEVMSRNEAERLLAKVPEENPFWVSVGRVLREVRELAEALANMSDETYAYHSNDVKTDFANWLRDIIKDETLAKRLEKPISRVEAEKIVAERVAFLSTILS